MDRREALDKLIRCIRDPKEFVDILCVDGRDGPEPMARRAYQIEWLRTMAEPDKNTAILAHSKSGKTTTVLVFALWTALFRQHKRIAIVSPTNERVGILIETFRKIANSIQSEFREQLPDFKEVPHDSRITDDTMSEFKFENESSVIIDVCTPTRYRGLTIDVLLFDEFDEMYEPIADEWLKMYFPMQQMNGAIKVLSTPRGMKQMWKIFERIIENGCLSKSIVDPKKWYLVKTDWRSTGIYFQRDISEIQKRTEPWIFENEYECQFSDIRDRNYRMELMKR